MKLLLKEFSVSGDLSYKITKINWCCDMVKEKEFIDLFSNPEDCLLIPKICIAIKDEFLDIDSGCAEVIPNSIEFCPYCGEKIFIDIVNQEDVSEYYNKLTEQELIFRKKSREGDSISKRQKNLASAVLLSDEANYYLSNDSIHSGRV